VGILNQELFRMNVFDVLLIFSVLAVLLVMLGLLFAIVTRRWALLKRLGLGVLIYASLYSLLLIGVALLSPQQVLAMHQLRCFDDWCASVERVERQSAVGEVKAQGTFYLVTIQVTSRAKRVSQREQIAAIYLLDGHRIRYDLSAEGQQALDAAGRGGKPLDSLVEAGGTFTYTAVFDLPSTATQPGLVINHDAFPGVIIIADDQSFLHKPTIVQLVSP
jgi:hypothetical protein